MEKKASFSKVVTSSSKDSPKDSSSAVAQSHAHAHKHTPVPYVVAEPSRELPSRLAPVHVKFSAIADFVLEYRDSLFSIIELHQSGPLNRRPLNRCPPPPSTCDFKTISNPPRPPPNVFESSSSSFSPARPPLSLSDKVRNKSAKAVKSRSGTRDLHAPVMTSLSALAEALEAAGAPLAGVNCIGWLVSQLPPDILKSHRAQQARVAEKVETKAKAEESGDDSEDGGGEVIAHHTAIPPRHHHHTTTPRHTPLRPTPP